MLVRVVYSRSENISPKFDDSIHRTTRDLQFEDCAEFMVVWRKDLIELYEDHVSLFLLFKDSPLISRE